MMVLEAGMSSPVTPPIAAEVIVDPTSSKCAGFTKALLRLPVLFHQLISYLFDDDGNFTTEVLRALLPTGKLEFFAAEVEESGRLLCDGSAVSRTTYADLFAVIGETYGEGDNVNTFNLPDFRDRFPIGQSATKPGASTGGEAAVALTEAQIPEHFHYLAYDRDGGFGSLVTSVTSIERGSTTPGGEREYVLQGNSFDDHLPTVGKSSLVGSDPDTEEEALQHNNVPPYLAVFVYIRT